MKIFFLLSVFILSLWAGKRIVSLSPSITEIVYALDAGEELVATSSYSLYPKEAKKLPIIGSYTNPHVEKVLSFTPSLVIGQSFNSDFLQKLQKLHIDTITLHLKTLQDIEHSIVTLGRVLHKAKKAQELLTKIEEAKNIAQNNVKPHSVMIVYGLKEDLRSGIYIAGEGIFFDDIIKLCGNTNAYTDASVAQPVLNYENVIALNPEQIIILHSHATEPNVNVQRALKKWYALPTRASKNGRISIVDEDYLHIPSQRVALTIKRLAEEMHD